MNRTQLDKKLRERCYKEITEALSEKFDTDVLPIATGTFCIPVLDDERNERFIQIQVSLPKGKRNGKGGFIPIDGYDAAQVYKEECDMKAAERAANLAENQRQVEAAKEASARKYKKKKESE